MNWTDASAFFAMGGHGRFVWGSYAVFVVLLVIEAWLARRRHRQALQALSAHTDFQDPNPETSA